MLGPIELDPLELTDEEAESVLEEAMAELAKQLVARGRGR